MTKRMSNLEELSKEIGKRDDVPFFFPDHFREAPAFVDNPNVHVAVGLMPSEFTSDDDD